MKKRKGKLKAILISATALVVVAAIGVGLFFGLRGKAEPVAVYPFYYVGMTEYWGDSKESYGPVTTDKIQTVFLTDTQIVTEILVSEGDEVKKGDVLMTFDTTLSDISLERKRLEVEKLKLDLEDAQKELKRIRNMRPMVIPTPSPDDDGDEDNGVTISGSYEISDHPDYDGSTREKALICWLASDAYLDDSLLELLRQRSEELQNLNASSGSAPEEETPATETPATEPPATDPAPTGGSEETDDGDTSGEPQDPEKPVDPEDPEDPDQEYIEVNDYYVVIKITQGNTSLGNRDLWQGLRVRGQGGNFRMSFFQAYGVPDYTLADSENSDTSQSQIDFGSGYTAAQIAQMRIEQEKKIKDLEFDIKIAEADYQIMQKEVSDGNVYATVDGKVISALTEEEAKQTQQPILKVSGGGGFYISCTVDELSKDTLKIGQEVTVQCWDNGGMYTGTITSMGDFPVVSYSWSSADNPNVTDYPFTVFVDETADLMEGMYVSVQYSAAESSTGVYLEKPFIRTENGQNYVLVKGADGTLEKRIVTVGKSVWGSYFQILSGLTEEDYVAFPYGKNVKEGVPAEESDDLSSLYGY